MNILAVSDIVGKSGVEKLKLELPKIIEEHKIDFTIVNGENAADGMGMSTFFKLFSLAPLIIISSIYFPPF